MAGFLETVEEGWGFVPTVLAISSAIGAPGPSATLRLDKRSLVFVQKALDWLDERWDLLDSIFSPDDWGLAMTLLEQTWVDSAASGDTDAQLEPARTAVVAWAHQALSPEPSLRRQSTNRICTTFNTRDPVRIPHPGRPFF
ncbi:MAG: hypothetical protein JKY65_28170 [Planctomycetes bacterium]|nr:hypothetical protein [Planctomycetota bacterium]